MSSPAFARAIAYFDCQLGGAVSALLPYRGDGAVEL